MELNTQSIQSLQIAKNKLSSQLVGYTRKNYTCSVRNGKHLFYNETKEEYKPPYFFNPLHKRQKLALHYKIAIKFYDNVMGKITMNG
jgi:hypothetical protein